MRALIIATVLASTAAHAVDFTTVLRDADNVIYDDLGQRLACQVNAESSDCKIMKPLTLGIACYRAIQFGEEATVTGTEKFEHGMLAFRVRDAKDLRLSAEETALLKKLIGKVYNPVVVAAAFPLLDPLALEQKK